MECPSPDPTHTSQDEILNLPSASHQHFPSPGEVPVGADVEMTDIKDTQQTESSSVEGRLLTIWEVAGAC